MILIFLSCLLLSLPSWAVGTDICEILDLKNCSGISKQGRRSSAHSLPSPSTAASNNPASVSFDRGFGVEVMAQNHNPLNFSFATGTGKMGGALLSPSLENNFFGNRVVELDEVYLDRRINDHQYKNQKLSLALGGKITDKKNFGLDIGTLFKRHSIIEKINLGIGISGRIGPLNFGGAVYKDDLYLELKDYIDSSSGLPYSVLLNATTYQETFTVQTYTVGTKFKNFAIDAAVIKSYYEFTGEDNEIHIYSGAFNYKSFLFNYAIRNDFSPLPEYKDKNLIEKKLKVNQFVSLQYSFNRHFIVGINYNYFLLKELSLTSTIFF